MKLKKGQRIRVSYTDETVEHYTSIETAEAGILETTTGCDFAACPDNVAIVNARGDEVSVMGCKWSVKLVN